MRLLASFALAAALAGCAQAGIGPERNADTAEYSYATGCYHAYQRLCLPMADELQRGECLEDGFRSCEPMGKSFRSWIESRPLTPASKFKDEAPKPKAE